MKNKYLVLGASGFIGASLVRKLAKENKDVYGFIRKGSNLWRLKNVSGIKMINGDITNKQDLTRKLIKINPTHIVNLATYGVYRDQKDTSKIIETNLTGSLNLFEAAKKLKNLKLIINTGSVYEYGSLYGQMKESIIAPARNFYDASKIATTSLAQAYSSLKILPICTLRPFTVYGPLEDSRRLIPSIIKTIQEGKKPQIASNATRDFIYIDDLIDAYVLALKKPKLVISQTINLGSGQPTKVKDFVSLIATSLKTDIKPINALKFSSPQDSKCWSDIRKAKKILNWSPQTENKEGINKTIAWLLK